jgi:hypothetical protein
VYCCPTEYQPTVLDIVHVTYKSDNDNVKDVTQMYTDEREIEVGVHHPKSNYWKKERYHLDAMMSKANREEEDIWGEGVNCCEVKRRN